MTSPNERKQTVLVSAGAPINNAAYTTGRNRQSEWGPVTVQSGFNESIVGRPVIGYHPDAHNQRRSVIPSVPMKPTVSGTANGGRRASSLFSQNRPRPHGGTPSRNRPILCHNNVCGNSGDHRLPFPQRSSLQPPANVHDSGVYHRFHANFVRKTSMNNNNNILNYFPNIAAYRDNRHNEADRILYLLSVSSTVKPFYGVNESEMWFEALKYLLNDLMRGQFEDLMKGMHYILKCSLSTHEKRHGLFALILHHGFVSVIGYFRNSMNKLQPQQVATLNPMRHPITDVAVETVNCSATPSSQYSIPVCLTQYDYGYGATSDFNPTPDQIQPLRKLTPISPNKLHLHMIR